MKKFILYVKKDDTGQVLITSQSAMFAICTIVHNLHSSGVDNKWHFKNTFWEIYTQLHWVHVQMKLTKQVYCCHIA